MSAHEETDAVAIRPVSMNGKNGDVIVATTTPMKVDGCSGVVNDHSTATVPSCEQANGSLVPPLPSKRKRKPTCDSVCYISEDVRKKKPRNPKPKTNEVDAEGEFAMNWICAECKEAECMMEPEATDLVVCDGPCRRLFHYPCVGLTNLPKEEDPFYCTDCKGNRHLCSLCLEYGMDNDDVFKCKDTSCGLFFHESCLSIHGVPVELVVCEENVEGEAPSPQRVFRCPAHQCWTCTQENEKRKEAQEESDKKSQASGNKTKKKSNKKPSVFQTKSERFLSRCLECARAYHVSCIPPTAKFHELATLCHEHAALGTLPQLSPEDSLQTVIEKMAESKTAKRPAEVIKTLSRRVRQKKTGSVFFHGLGGAKLSRRQEHLVSALQGKIDVDENDTTKQLLFCLPRELKEQVQVRSKPPNYRHVHMLQYSASKKPPIIPPEGGMCECGFLCGEDCINRILYTECYGDVEATKGKAKTTNCRLGLNCGNRQLGQRQVAKCKPQREHGRGWGLVADARVSQGDLVVEYVGEVIDEATKVSRLAEWSAEHPNDPNFYLMQLQPGWFIDARNVANLSRFVNHSCAPNCRLTSVNCNGKMRCGIFALQDINPGEFLSYDYQFDTRDGDRFICLCGADDCRGTLKGGSERDDTAKIGSIGGDPSSLKRKVALKSVASTSFHEDKKVVDDFNTRRGQGISLVDDLAPGADQVSSKAHVASGPDPEFSGKSKRLSVFLWRNAKQGANFKSRFERLKRKCGTPK